MSPTVSTITAVSLRVKRWAGLLVPVASPDQKGNRKIKLLWVLTSLKCKGLLGRKGGRVDQRNHVCPHQITTAGSLSGQRAGSRSREAAYVPVHKRDSRKTVSIS